MLVFAQAHLRLWVVLVLLTGLISLTLVSCGRHGDHEEEDHQGQHNEHHGHHDETDSTEEIAKGPHNGRLLKDASFALELSIFETGVAPEFRAWAVSDGKTLAPQDVNLKITLTRLGNKNDEIVFVPHDDFLRSTTSIHEPHSFHVSVIATYKGKNYQWQYESYEGRTRIANDVAANLGVTTAVAGPATLTETFEAYGSIIADSGADRDISARFDGVITAVHVKLGDQVVQGQPLVTVESNESLRGLVLNAPLSGTVVAHQAKVGEQTHGKTLMRIVDTSKVYAELAIFPSQWAQVKKGARVVIAYDTRASQPAEPGVITGTIDYIGLAASPNQSVTVRAKLDGSPLPLGAQVKATIQVAEHQVPLAVKRLGLQAFRDFTVVYAQVGDEYEVRMLELGRTAGEWVEVLAGLEPGTRYVTENSFVVKADIEKSGASHDH